MHVIRRICDEVAVMESGKSDRTWAGDTGFENPQHTVTKRFVKEDLNDDFETSLTELEPLEKDAYIVRLVFAGSTTTEPIVSSLSTAYDIKINILEANIKNTKMEQSAFSSAYSIYFKCRFRKIRKRFN